MPLWKRRRGALVKVVRSLFRTLSFGGDYLFGSGQPCLLPIVSGHGVKFGLIERDRERARERERLLEAVLVKSDC